MYIYLGILHYFDIVTNLVRKISSNKKLKLYTIHVMFVDLWYNTSQV